MATVSINITGKDTSSPAFRSATDSVDRLHSSIKTLVGGLASLYIGDKLFAGFKAGIEAVDSFQQSVIKTAAIITSLQGGENIADNYKKATEYATGLQTVLQQVDARTTLNLTGLQQITEEMVKQGVVLDYNNAGQVEAFTRLANAAAVYSQNGRNEVQLRQEVRALMMGQVDQNSQLASMLQRTVDGPLQQQVEKWKQSGTLLEELGKRLAGFGPASSDLNNTWSAVKTSLQTSVDLVLRAGFGAILKDIVEWLNQANNYLKSHQEMIGGKIREGWETFKSVASTLIPIIKGIYDNFEPFATILVGGLIVSAVSGIVTKFIELEKVILACRTALISMNVISAAGAAGNVASGAMAAGGTLATMGTWAARGGIAAAGGLALGYALQPAVRWADKKLYQNFGVNLTGQAMYNEAEQRNADSDARWKFFTTENANYRRGAAGASAPKIDLQDTPEQTAAKLKLGEQELVNFKALKEQETAIATGQAEIQLTTLKSNYDQGLVSTRDYYENEKRIALEAAQLKFQNAAVYLNKEQEYLELIKSKKGEKSPEYEKESANNKKALQDMQIAQLDYAKVTLDSENKMSAALRKREEEYAKLKVTTLEASGQYVESERLKQEMDQKSIEFIRLKTEAERGEIGAIEALANVEKQRAVDRVNSQNKESEAARSYAAEVATMRDSLATLNGEDATLIKSNADLRAGFDKMAGLQDKIKLAWAQGNVVAISALSAQISLQDQLNNKLQNQLKFEEQVKVLTGEIVGFNNGHAVYRDSWQSQNQYQSAAAAAQLSNSAANLNTAVSNLGTAGQQLTASAFSLNDSAAHFTTGLNFYQPGGWNSAADDYWAPQSWSVNYPGRATGGPVYSGNSYLVGERGPEILRMGGQGGAITPNDKLGGRNITLTGDINITLQSTGSATTDADQLARQIIPALRKYMGRSLAA